MLDADTLVVAQNSTDRYAFDIRVICLDPEDEAKEGYR